MRSDGVRKGMSRLVCYGLKVEDCFETTQINPSPTLIEPL